MTCRNPEMVSGKWVNGILWDHDTTYTVDLLSEDPNEVSDSSNEDEEEIFGLDSFGKGKLTSRESDGDCEYGENISLVNTVELIENYLPDYQEEIRKLELKRKQDEEKRRLAMASSIVSRTSNATPATQPTSSATSQVKDSSYRAQQAREKAERLAKLESAKTPALNLISYGVSSQEDSLLNQEAANRKKRLNASTELEHSTPASHHLNCKVSFTTNELKYYRRSVRCSLLPSPLLRPLGRGMQHVWNISFDSKRSKNKV